MERTAALMSRREVDSSQKHFRTTEGIVGCTTSPSVSVSACVGRIVCRLMNDEVALMSTEVCGIVDSDPQQLNDPLAAFTPTKVGDDRGNADLQALV